MVCRHRDIERQKHIIVAGHSDTRRGIHGDGTHGDRGRNNIEEDGGRDRYETRDMDIESDRARKTERRFVATEIMETVTEPEIQSNRKTERRREIQIQ